MDTYELARKVRIHAVKMVNKGGSSHIGSVLSIVDVLAVLYGSIMQYDCTEPKSEGRDRFILSKGHAGAGVYAVLAECGFFDKDKLMQHYQNGSIFSGHVSHKGMPGVELSTGALGHGLPVGVGMAYAAKIDEQKHRVFVLMSDGELDEGSNWEAMLFAAHHKLTQVTAIIDRNGLQSMGSTEVTMALEPLVDKFIAFGWNVVEVDGHDHERLNNILRTSHSEKPTVVIANTLKGKGVSFMENNNEWHHNRLTEVNYKQALQEMGEI